MFFALLSRDVLPIVRLGGMEMDGILGNLTGEVHKLDGRSVVG